MTTRTKDQNTLALGCWNVLCDRCGFKFKNVDIKEEWTGLMVCKECWEPRHPQDFLRAVEEDTSVPYSRPDGAEQGGTDIDGNTFPPTRTDTTTDRNKPDEDGDGSVDGTFGSNNRTI